MFDAKRDIVKALQAARAEHEANFHSMVNATVSGFNAAVNNTQAGLVFTKETAVNLSDELTVDNAMNIVQNAFLSTRYSI